MIFIVTGTVHRSFRIKKTLQLFNYRVFRLLALFGLILSVLAGARTPDPLIKSQLLYQLSYEDFCGGKNTKKILIYCKLLCRNISLFQTKTFYSAINFSISSTSTGNPFIRSTGFSPTTTSVSILTPIPSSEI